MSASIISIGENHWVFSNEAALEDWLWLNLEALLQLKPLRRQYFIRGQYCDILAIGQDKQLYILELKNTEDRYIVQQMTRYYDALVAEKPFQEEIDYQKPPKLLAIAPSFHADTMTDLKYHTLDIDLWQFRLNVNSSSLGFNLLNQNQQLICTNAIPYPSSDSSENQIPPPPRFLLNLLNDFPLEHQQSYLQMRDRILSFDHRIQEIKSGSGVRYGRGINKPCAQLQLIKSLNYRQICCYLWLPSLSLHQQRKQLLRMAINGHLHFKDHNFFLVHSPDRTRRTGKSWRLNSSIQLAKQLKDESVLEFYHKMLENQDPNKNFEILLEIALENWLERYG